MSNPEAPEDLAALLAEMEEYGAGLPSVFARQVWHWSQRLRACLAGSTQLLEQKEDPATRVDGE